MNLKIYIKDNRKDFKVQGIPYVDFINQNNKLIENLVFNDEKYENNVRTINLTDEDNIYIFYKELNLTLKQGFEFELDSTCEFYDNMIKKKYENYNYENKTIFDIGACNGLDTLYFSKIVGKQGKVISLEPDCNNFKNLKYNIEKNNVHNNIILINKALYNDVCTQEFSLEGSQGAMIVGKSIDSMNSQDLIKLRKSKKIQVECTTINELFNRGFIADIIKIDIEGAEYDLIYNDSFLNGILNKSIFIFELHSIEKCKENIDILKKYFIDRDYCYEIFDSKILGLHYGFYPN